MKNFRSILYIATVMLIACEKDDELLTIKTDSTPASITTTASQLNSVITPEKFPDKVRLTWDKSDYGVTTEVVYVVEAAAECSNFSKVVSLGSTTANLIETTVEALNTKVLNELGLPQHLASNVSVRVTSKIKDKFLQTSQPVTFSVTPWSAWEKSLWISADDSQQAVYASDEDVYDGYVSLTKDKSFAFSDRKSCGGTSFGVSGNTITEGASEKLSVGDDGYYRVKANTATGAFEVTKITSFGAIGDATPGGWGNSTPMTYEAERKVWEVSLDLTNGALKFRANNEWTINYGPAESNEKEGTLKLDDPGAISIAETGNYTVTIDMSKTKSPDFIYTVKKNSDNVAPAQLWVPGEYQGWNPGGAPTIKALNADQFEGYVYISSPTGYKFTSAPDWNHINYGDAGTAGNLTVDGLANGMGLATPGVYKFNVNVNALTYTATLINSMGMVGPATAGGSDAGWGTSVPMNYDATNDVWKATINLSPGAIKFRANNEWTINYGPSDSGSLEGNLIFDDPGAINITEAGSYSVTVDFSRSEAPYKYTYKLVKN